MVRETSEIEVPMLVLVDLRDDALILATTWSVFEALMLVLMVVCVCGRIRADVCVYETYSLFVGGVWFKCLSSVFVWPN